MYYQIEKRFDLRKEEIPQKLEVLSEALDGLFGYGSRIIESQIERSLYEKLELRFEQKEGWTLREHAEHLEKKWHQNHKDHAKINSVVPLLTLLGCKLLNASLTKLLPNCSY